MFSRSSAHSRGRMHGIGAAIDRWFPMPKLLMPRGAGIDISDSSIKWIVLAPSGEQHRVQSYGEMPLPEGVVVNGAVHDARGLSIALADVKKQLGGVDCAHAALPEEAAYVFGMPVPAGTSREQALRMVEFEFEGRVPIPPSAAVYDFDPIPGAAGNEEVGVVVFPRELAEGYAEAFEHSGIALLSLELEARSIARAVSAGTEDEPITLLVDFGRARTGFAVIKRGIPIFTSTVEVGGETIIKSIMESMSMTREEAEHFKNYEGLLADGGKSPGVEAMAGTAAALADEIARHYHYWDTRRNDQGDRMTPVGRVLLVGGSSNLYGLPDYIAGRVQAPTEIGDVWQHIVSFDDYIPPIDKRYSLQYATAIGLALRSV